MTNSNVQDKVAEKREVVKKSILEEYPDISKDTLEFVLSLPLERRVSKVSELETTRATKEQQEDMERLTH